MSDGKFTADFVAANLEKILSIGTSALGKIDALVQLNLRTAYTNYLDKTRLKYSKSKTFFFRDQPVELYSYYVPTGISCGNKIINTPTFRNCTEFTKRLVISGTGGSGKSVLIKHLFLNCIENKEFVPILIELRDLNSQEKNLNDFINENLSTFKFKLSDEYVTKAKEMGHFSFFLDGFDEITPKLRNKITRQILSISKQYPNCPVFLSSRPDDILTGLEDFSTFKMKPLELNEALNLVAKLPYDEVIKGKFSEDLSNGLFAKHKSFLSNPLLLSIMLLTYGENAEIPTKLSLFYNHAYEALFSRHDANKGGYNRNRLTDLDTQDFSKVFSLFSLLTYEKRLIKMSRTQCIDYINKSSSSLNLKIKPEDYLDDLLSAVCLMVEDGLEITFSHRSFQEYFVARKISISSPEIQNKLIERYWVNIYFDNVIILLWEINPELVERELFVPKLEKLFKDIGVKKKIGITHYTKYIKYAFSEIHIDKYGTYFIHPNNIIERDKSCLSYLLHMVIRKYSNFNKTKFKERQTNNRELSKLHLYKKKKILIQTKNLSYKSPFIKDLNKYHWQDMEYLTKGFEIYKTLKSKHINSVQNFDTLLGIK